MTMNVTINNFRKVKEASFAIAPIALLVGENENGKSSIAQAVALAAAQQALPRSIAKKDAKMLVTVEQARTMAKEYYAQIALSPLSERPWTWALSAGKWWMKCAPAIRIASST